LAKGLIAAGQKTYRAAMAKDANMLLETGGDLSEACDACHKKYREPVREREAAAKAKAAKQK
jgi:cytochrome c556